MFSFSICLGNDTRDINGIEHGLLEGILAAQALFATQESLAKEQSSEPTPASVPDQLRAVSTSKLFEETDKPAVIINGIAYPAILAEEFIYPLSQCSNPGQMVERLQRTLDGYEVGTVEIAEHEGKLKRLRIRGLGFQYSTWGMELNCGCL